MNLIIAASNGGVTDILRETAETFGWNWKLFLSQVISFCIVAFLLQRFAYKPILAVLEERRRKIEEGQINAEKIKKELAEAEKRYQEILAKANADAQKMIDEARESAAHLSERKQQEAIAAAEQIITKAREASAIEHERTMESLKRELGRLVVDTTSRPSSRFRDSIVRSCSIALASRAFVMICSAAAIASCCLRSDKCAALSRASSIIFCASAFAFARISW